MGLQSGGHLKGGEGETDRYHVADLLELGGARSLDREVWVAVLQHQGLPRLHVVGAMAILRVRHLRIVAAGGREATICRDGGGGAVSCPFGEGVA